MPFTYKPLWKLLIDKDLKKNDLIDEINISRSTLSKLSHDETVSMDIIERLCSYLKCDIKDIISFQEKK